MSAMLSEVLAVFGNANHLAGFLAMYEARIRDAEETSKCLTQAPNYFAWLNVAPQQVLDRLREMIYVNTENDESFDMSYCSLLDHLIEKHSPDSDQLEPVILFAKIRHLLVHKGFPNPHSTPSERARNIAKAYPFSAEEVHSLAEKIREPKSYNELKKAHGRANAVINSFEQDFERDFGFMKISTVVKC